MARGAASLLVGLLTVSGAGHALARGEPSAPVRVLFWPELGAAPQGPREDELLAALRRRVPDGMTSSPLARAPEVAARREADGADVGRVEEALGLARRSFLAFDFDDARARLVALRDGELAVLSLPTQASLLGELQRLLAQVELAAGRQDEAALAARLAVQILPDTPRGGLPPEYAQMEGEARASLLRAGMRPLRVDSDPVGADVLVDGRRVGVTPLTVDVPAGAHVVRVESPGRGVAAQVVSVEASGALFDPKLPVDAADPILLRRISRGDLNPADQPSRDALLQRAGASHLVSYRAQGSRVLARVWLPGATDGPLVGPGEPGDAAFVDRLADALLGVPQKAAAAEASPLGVAAAATTPPYKAWWFWTAIGAGVATAVGVALLLSANRPQQHAIVRPK